MEDSYMKSSARVYWTLCYVHSDKGKVVNHEK